MRKLVVFAVVLLAISWVSAAGPPEQALIVVENPEPGTAALLSLVLGGLVAGRRARGAVPLRSHRDR